MTKKNLNNCNTQFLSYIPNVEHDPVGRFKQQPVLTYDKNTINRFIQEYNNTDIYITNNLFYDNSQTNTFENLGVIKVINIDIDFRLHSADLELKNDFVIALLDYAREGYIPYPHKIITSGRGLYVRFNIDDETNKSSAKLVALLLIKSINDFLNDFNPMIATSFDNNILDKGASQNSVQYFRIENSINSKALKGGYTREQSTVKSLYHDECLDHYTFDDILCFYNYSHDEIEEINITFKEHDFSKGSDFKPRYAVLNEHKTPYTLHMARIHDLELLQERRNQQATAGLIADEGYRSNFVFEYGQALSIYEHDTQAIKNRMIEFNNDFIKPLDDKELKYLIEQAVNRLDPYLRKNISIIASLKISEDEQRELKTIISAKEKQRRKNVTRNKKRAPKVKSNKNKRIQRNEEIRLMHNNYPYFTQRHLAKLFNCSVYTINKAINE